MNEDLNKELCQLLGICWHEPEKLISNDLPCGIWLCTCGEEYSPFYECHIEDNNPDFTSDSGKVLLLREMRKRGDFSDFLWSGTGTNLGALPAQNKYIDNTPISKVYVYGLELIHVFYMTDDTDKLAIAARDFLRKEKRR